jgi:alkanesulfonate monooxygenase SsuD/methylene tetrahydromethanopterin reductase-like flavin-dependent oxidoreductase (luciferase family)
VSAARFYVRHGLLRHPDFPTEADVTAESLAPHLVLGTPAQCVETLQRAEEERGIDYVMICCRVSTGPSLERTREQIMRLGEEVVAPIHARSVTPDHPAIPAACRD